MKLSDDEFDHIDMLLKTHVVSEDETPMILSELDGYLTGIVACPEFIPASEWLPSLFNLVGKVEFPDQKTSDTVTEAVMKYHTYIAEELKKSSWINPIYATASDSDEIVRGPWLDSFLSAINIRKEVWKKFFLQADVTAMDNFGNLLVLAEVFTSENAASYRGFQGILDSSPESIPKYVAVILDAVRGRPSSTDFVSADIPFMPKVRLGRNEPCACGSGRKYKKCCGRI